MNENYLWDKSGEDREIENLENALRQFGYRETAPPILPAKIIPFNAKTPRRFFQFASAFAACAIAAAIVSVIWLTVSRPFSTLETAATVQTNRMPQLKAAEVAPAIDSPVESVAAPKNSAARKAFKIIKTARPIQAKSELIARNIKPQIKTVKLTDEEKFAYGQLLLALSITGEKLKIVKDKAEGLDKSSNNLSDGK